MTIDSTYKMELKQSDDDNKYFFEFESVEDSRVRVYIRYTDGTTVELVNEALT